MGGEEPQALATAAQITLTQHAVLAFAEFAIVRQWRYLPVSKQFSLP